MRKLYDVTYRMEAETLPIVLQCMQDKLVTLVTVGEAPVSAEPVKIHRKRGTRGPYHRPSPGEPIGVEIMLAYVTENPGVDGDQCRAYFEMKGYSKNSASARLSELRDKNLVYRTPEGKYYAVQQKAPVPR